MNRVTLIQLRGNIPCTLSEIGGIGSKYNPTTVSISTKLERSLFYPMKYLEALQSISQIPKESKGEGQYKITLLYLIRNNIWFLIPGVPCFLLRVGYFLDDLHYLSFLQSLKMFLEWLLSSSSDVSLPRTLLRIMVELITSKASAFTSTLDLDFPLKWSVGHQKLPLRHSDNILFFDFTLGEFEEGCWSFCPFPTVFDDCSITLAWALSSPQLWYHVNFRYIFYARAIYFIFHS